MNSYFRLNSDESGGLIKDTLQWDVQVLIECYFFTPFLHIGEVPGLILDWGAFSYWFCIMILFILFRFID